jgi:hypothetical protein
MPAQNHAESLGSVFMGCRAVCVGIARSTGVSIERSRYDGALVDLGAGGSGRTELCAPGPREAAGPGWLARIG